MDKKQDETRITVRFPADVVAALRVTAHENQRSLNGEIVWAVRAYLARQPKPSKERP